MYNLPAGRLDEFGEDEACVPCVLRRPVPHTRQYTKHHLNIPPNQRFKIQQFQKTHHTFGDT